MIDLISLFKADISIFIKNAFKEKIINEIDFNKISFDHSSKSKKGHLSSNIFLVLSKNQLNKKLDLIEYISKYIKNLYYVENIDFAKVGFYNIFFKKDFLVKNIKNLISNPNIKNYRLVDKQKINIEFVSANPTGPIHVAHMRGAVLGDVLASLLTTVGHEVTREYYVNNAGSQITTLGISLFKRYQQLHDIDSEILDGEYPGSYLIVIAKNIKKMHSNEWINEKDIKKRAKFFEDYAVKYLINEIKRDLDLINISFDKYSYESDIVDNKYIDNVFKILKQKNLVYEGMLPKPLGDDNKTWEPRKQLLFRSTSFEDDSDRPFQKFNGEWTYFANDSAYHYDKFLRGFDKLINIWGADHIGYISRLKSIVDSISNKKNYLDVHICQIVRLLKNKEILKMSKRDGNFISLKEIFNEVGKDALRYYMVSTKSETPMDFNIDKVIEKNRDNPVFYCQYAFARASSITRKAKELKKIPDIYKSIELFDINFISDFEWEIILKILYWPYILKQAAETRQPHRITNYLEDLSSVFHSFWNKGKDDVSLRFIDENNINKTITKLIWIESFKITLSQAFKIIGIDSPESM